MSALPKAVQAQIDKAEQLVKDLYSENGKLKGSDGGQEGAGSSSDAASSEETASQEQNAKSTAQQQQQQPSTTPPPASQPSASDWEQRYRVLQGKYNAEVPRLTKQIQELQLQLNGVQALLASFQHQQQTKPAEPPKPLVDEKEIKEFGPDLYDFVRRVARQEQGALLPEIDKRIAPVVQKVETVKQTAETATQLSAEARRHAMFDLLTQQVPEWRQLNEDPGFLAWLDQVDPYTGKVRAELLAQAEAAYDGPRVVAFFKGYQKEHATVAPATSASAAAAPAGQPAGEPAATQPTLEKLVAPGTPKAGAARAPDGSGKRVWTRAEIGKFYADVAAGKYRSTDGQQRYREIEAEIFRAQREGRIRA